MSARFTLVAVALLALALYGCSSMPVEDEDAGVGMPPAPQQSHRDAGILAVRSALGMIGVPYRYGGNTPDGFDCSGLVQYAYARAGRRLPRSVGAQVAETRPVSRSELRPGDLLVFHLNGERNSHIGLYIGNGRFVHAPSTGKQVSTAQLSNPFWRRHLAGARRVP